MRNLSYLVNRHIGTAEILQFRMRLKVKRTAHYENRFIRIQTINIRKQSAVQVDCTANFSPGQRCPDTAASSERNTQKTYSVIKIKSARKVNFTIGPVPVI